VAALARTSAALNAPWDRRRDETDLDYGHFKIWLELNPRPPPLDVSLAIKHEWHPRAEAFDVYQSLQTLSPKDAAEQVFRMWTLTVTNETRKWFAQSLQRGEPVLQPERVSDFLELVTDPTRNQAGRPSYDVSKLEESELAEFLRLLEKVQIKE
jgi:hypothetical protein